MLAIGPFRLDVENQRLEREGREVTLSPKAFSVLRHLSGRPGSLVTKQELLDAVWPDTFVQEGVLKAYVKEIRKALGDDADNPQYIRTEHRRGYRFLNPSVAAARPMASSGLTGRAAELAHLRARFEEAVSTGSRVVFLTGEAGIGKTAVLDAFLAEAAAAPGVLIARGQCIEQSGSGEPYLPVFEAISHLCRQAGSAGIVDTLRKHAPMWLVQMPSLVAPEERHQLQLEVVGSNSQRMIREMAEALTALTETHTIVLALEDLHWSDPSTVDLLGALARRSGLQRLLVIATYRPVDVILTRHPVRALKQDLQAKGECTEMALELLPVSAVEQYLASRFPSTSPLASGVAAHLHRQTDGNPLFLIQMTDYLVAQEMIFQEGDSWRLAVPLEQLAPTVPDSLRQMIERQFERLDENEQRVLEAGAVAGIEFSARALSHVLGLPHTAVEECCEDLAETQRFLRQGATPQASADDSGRFAFVHALYREGLYQRLTATRKKRMHLALGEYGEASGAFSPAGLAQHFELGGNMDKAIGYLQKAAGQAALTYARREALSYLNRARVLAGSLPVEEQATRELEIRRRTAEILRFVGEAAWSVSELEELTARAHALGRTADEVVALLESTTSLMWVARRNCLPTTEQAVALAEQSGNEELIRYARGYRAFWRMLLIEWTREDTEAFEQGRAAVERIGTPSARTMYLWMSTAIAALQSQYSVALELAGRCIASALGIGDAYHYLATMHFRFWAQFHSGQLGATLRTLKEVGGMSQSSNLQAVAGSEGGWRNVLQTVGTAAVHLEARDFQGTVDRTLPIWRDLKARSIIMGTGSLVFSAATAAMGLMGLGRHEEAREVLDETQRHAEQNRMVMEPRVEIRFQLACAEYELEHGAPAQARRHAERVLELALPPGERTYQAHAHRVLAEASLAEGRAAEALAGALTGRDVLAGSEPLGAWRIFHTAARCAEAAGDTATAGAMRRRASNAIARMVASLDGFPELVDVFLSNPTVAPLRLEALEDSVAGG